MAHNVSVCENGGSWIPQGSAYPDGIGMTVGNWDAFGGPTGNGPAADLAPEHQAEVLQAFLNHYTGGWWPDQHGCTGSY